MINVEYPKFKEACFAMGLLDDDKEYIDVILETSNWGSDHCLHNLFATLLCANHLSRLYYPRPIKSTWHPTWHLETHVNPAT